MLAEKSAACEALLQEIATNTAVGKCLKALSHPVSKAGFRPGCIMVGETLKELGVCTDPVFQHGII